MRNYQKKDKDYKASILCISLDPCGLIKLLVREPYYYKDMVDLITDLEASSVFTFADMFKGFGWLY